MYKVTNKTPKNWDSVRHGKPIIVLEEPNGGQSVVAHDDHCFVLFNGSDDREFKMVYHWYKEAAEALARHMANAPEGSLFVMVERRL